MYDECADGLDDPSAQGGGDTIWRGCPGLMTLNLGHKVGDQRGDLIRQLDLREMASPGQHHDGGVGHVGKNQIDPG